MIPAIFLPNVGIFILYWHIYSYSFIACKYFVDAPGITTIQFVIVWHYKQENSTFVRKQLLVTSVLHRLTLYVQVLMYFILIQVFLLEFFYTYCDIEDTCFKHYCRSVCSRHSWPTCLPCMQCTMVLMA